MTLTFITDLEEGRYLWAGHIQSVVQALRGRYVISGCKVTAGSGLQVNVASGKVYYLDSEYDVGSVVLSLASNSSGYPRADLIVWDGSDETVKVIQGSGYWTDGENYYAIAPQPSDSHVLLALVVINDGDSTVNPDNIYDLRVSGEYETNRLIMLAVDDTVTSVTGSTETTVKTFRFAKIPNYMNVRKLYVVASMWVSGSYGRLRVYIDGVQYLELGSSSTSEDVVYGSIDVSGLSNGMHDVEIRLKNDGSYVTYNQYLAVLGDV